MYKRAQQTIRSLSLCLAVILTVMGSNSVLAQSAAPAYAGSIVYSIGDVVAVDVDGETRPLGRRTDIFVGDTLYTGPDSSAQLSMSDSAQIILHESTIFQINEYNYESGADESVVLELIEGGFRTVTGSVLKDKYRADVRGFSSIGIRGTEYEALKLADDRLLIGMYEGGVTVSNFAGEIDLGLGADFDFAEVQDAFLPPVGLDLMPVRLDQLQFAVAVAAQELDAAQPSNNVAGAIGTQDGNLIAAIDASQTPAGADTGPTASADFFNYVASSVAGADEDPAAGTPAAAIDGQAAADAAGDLTVSTRNRRLARGQAIRATDSLVGTGIDALVGIAGDASGLESAAEDLIDDSLDLVAGVTQQESALLAELSNTAAVLTTPDISAVFDTLESITSVATQQVDAANEAVAGAIADVADAADLATEPSAAVGDTTPVGGIVEAVEPDAIAGSPAGGLITAEVVDLLPSDIVDAVVTVVGDVTESSSGGTTTVAVIIEDEPGAAAADVVAGGESETADDLVTTVTDTVEELVEEVVETVEEVVESDPVEEVVDLIAAITAPAEDAVEEAVEPTEPVVEEETVVEDVLDGIPSTGSILALKKAPAADDNWGAWNTPVPEHIANSMTITAGDYSVDLTPTPLDNLTGSYSYAELVDYQGHGSAGALTSLQAGFDVDFSTGLISNGRLSVAVADTQNWQLGFDGLIDSGVVDLNSLGGSLRTLSGQLDSISPIDGDLSGAFTGAQAESFVGGFELLDLQNPLNSVEGIYTIER